MTEKICVLCIEKRHGEGVSKRGICQRCWGTGFGRFSMFGFGTLCDDCTPIFPARKAPMFCDHGKQMSQCETCQKAIEKMKAQKACWEEFSDFILKHKRFRTDSSW